MRGNWPGRLSFSMGTKPFIIVIPRRKSLSKTEEQIPPKQKPAAVKIQTTENTKGIREADGKDKIAKELFMKVLVRLDPSENHLLNGIANKMRQLDKSFKIRNTSYKKMTMLAKEFETRGWLKTKRNKDGHLMITDLEADG